MTDKRFSDVRQAAPRRRWVAPKLSKMAAGAAENNAGNRSDNQITFS